jgi:[protein-PII] uridylyltransferase
LWAGSGLPERGVALAAVGGYGRGELSPGSDIDLLVIHEPGLQVESGVKALLYPLWNAGAAVDHSVRTPDEVRALADEDLAVVLGLLDARVLAGDAELGHQAIARVLAQWRARAHRRLGPLRGACNQRADRFGEVAFAAEPDLKESRGGLRDVTVLRAVAASGVADRPHGRVDGAAALLSDVRDALHLATGRSSDRLVRQAVSPVATTLGFEAPDELRRAVAVAGRDIAHALDMTWRRVVPGADGRRRRRVLVPGAVPRARLAPGVDAVEHEVVLGRDARLDDPVLPLRAAAAASQAGLVLAPPTVEALDSCPPLPDPWPPSARDALISLLGGPGLLAVWEDMDRAGLVSRWLPEWEPVRSLPHVSPVHRWTVDRHIIEAVAVAAQLTRRVHRPDLLLLAALVHDLGKAEAGEEHPEAGAARARAVCQRVGLDPDDTDLIVRLTRHHLLLVQTAMLRDLDDPATVASVLDRVGDADALDLLHALTEADARATGPGAWTSWRASLVGDLVARVHARLRGVPSRRPVEGEPVVSERLRRLAEAGGLTVHLRPAGDTATVTVVAPDRTGLLATVAGVLALHRLAVRSAVVATIGASAVQEWQVEPQYGDRPDVTALRETLRRALDGSLDVAARLASRDAAYRDRGPTSSARVQVVENASADATVVEVRAHDAPGLLHRIAAAIAAVGVSIRSARVATLGSEVVDSLYLVDPVGRPLPRLKAASVVGAIASALDDGTVITEAS